MERIRIGIVGAGDIVRTQHVPGFAQIKGVKVTAVCNRSPESSERFARDFGVPRVFERWEDLAASPDVDAVFIGTWPCLHCPVTLAALEAGKHVFCQARMAMNAREAKTMADAAEKAKADRGLVTMLCPSPYGLKGDWLMQRLLRERFCGDIHTIFVWALNDRWADPATPFHWRLDPQLSGVNTLAVGLYVEWVHRWFGATRRIGAVMKTCIPVRRDPATGEKRAVVYPDVVLAHGEMASGALVSYEFGGVHRHGGGTASEKSTIEAYGGEGTVKYVVGEDRIVGAQGDSPLEIIPLPDDTVRPWTVEADWIEAIRTGGSPSPTFADGLKYMDVTEALYHGAATGLMIDLPLTDTLRNTPVFFPASREADSRTRTRGTKKE